MRLNELSHAVRFKNKEIIDQQHIPFNLREYAKDGFVDWYADRLSMMFFIQAAGYTAPWMKFDGYTTTIKPVHYGFNEPLEPSKLRIFRSGNKKADEELTKDDEFTLPLIDDAVKRAKLANPKIRSVHVNGESVYVMYLHPEQVMQLRTNTDAGQWLDITEAVCSESRAKTPILMVRLECIMVSFYESLNMFLMVFIQKRRSLFFLFVVLFCLVRKVSS